MDIAITLSKNLWDKICSGEKQYECRKRIPRNFMKNYDKVWIILKGTNKVVGFFNIDAFLTCIDVQEIKDNYLQKICVDKAWFDRYAEHEDVLHLWHISTIVFELAIPQDKENFLGLTDNPQCYAYCRPNIQDQRCFKRGKAFTKDIK